MNPKIQKVIKEIEKTKAKLADTQFRLRELERQKTELENAEIVAMVRSRNLTESEFAALLQSRNSNPVPMPVSVQKNEMEELEDEE